MYIPMEAIYTVVAILGAVALVYLILTLNNVNKLLKNVNGVISSNIDNINTSLNNIPNVIDNCNDISENVKDITEVATEVTADFIVTKDSVKSNVDLVIELINIIKQAFMK